MSGPSIRRSHWRVTDMLLLLVQVFNGLQFGVMLFLMAAGLTLVFGIMNVVNLAHGSLYMIGAYAAPKPTTRPAPLRWRSRRGSAPRLVTGVVIEVGIFRTALCARPSRSGARHFRADILFFNDLVRFIWGSSRSLCGRAALPLRSGRNHSRRALSGLPARHHRCRAGGGGGALSRDRAHALRYGGPCRRLEPGDGGRARRQYRGSLHCRLRSRGFRWRASPGSWPARSSP